MSIRLSGEFEVNFTQTPTVIVRVGNAQVPATVTGRTFVADLALVNSASMVTIESSGDGAQYRALLGTAGLLKAQSGADRVLVVAENPSLRMSPIATSIYFFIQRELGNRLPASDDEMDKALRALTVSDLSVAANMLRSVERGEFPLPAGFTSGLALLGNREAYRQFLGNNTPVRDNAETNLRTISAGVFDARDLERNWLLTGRIAREGMTYSQPNVQLMERRPGGFAVSAGQSRTDPNFGAQIDASGDLGLTPEGQPYFDTSVFNSQIEPNPALQPIVQRATVLRETYRRLFVGKRQQLWLQIRDERRNYPQYPSTPAASATTSALLFASVLEESVVSATSANVIGRRALPFFCLQASRVSGEASVLQNCEFAAYNLGANGFGQVDGIGPKIDGAMLPIAAFGSAGVQWRIDGDGVLRMDGPNYSAKFWRLGVSDTVADAMVFQVVSGTQVLAGHAIALDGNLPTFFTAADLAGTWTYGTFETVPDAYAYDPGNVFGSVRFVRYADGSQDQASPISETSTSPAFTLIQRSGWVLSGLNLYDTRYRANVNPTQANTQFYYSCASAQAAGASQCAPVRVRYFRPFTRVGNRWYGIEDVYSRLTTTSYVAPFQFERSSRPNYYEKL